jgi:hypothetical protein
VVPPREAPRGCHGFFVNGLFLRAAGKAGHGHCPLLRLLYNLHSAVRCTTILVYI